VQCALCGMAVNEVEGFVAENISEDVIEEKIKEDICNIINGELQQMCDDLVQQIPFIIQDIEETDSVSVVCVDLGYCPEPITERTDPGTVPKYIINLDLAPDQRLAEICSNTTYQNVTQYLINTMDQLLPGNGATLNLLGQALNEFYFPQEFAAEIKGCAEILNVPYGWATLLNLGYEVSDACTSIVAQTDDGKIYHARNLDFGDGMGFTDSLKELVYQAEYQQGGTTVFHVTTMAGYVGVLSGLKPGAFSVTIDTRFYPDGADEIFYEVIAAIIEKNASLVSFLTREVIQNENNFQAALKELSDVDLIADVYYILAGVSAGEGAVITRNRTDAADTWMLNSPSRWFEVQTNYDHWEQPPWYDNRVTPAENGMEAMGQSNLSLQGMFEVLSTKPVLNLQTTYSILACPADGTYMSFTRYCKYPCVQ